MNYIICAPEKINIEVTLPASKSLSNRALILNALCQQKGSLQNVAKCDDTDTMLAALASTNCEVNIGAAGTAMRFLTAYFSVQEGRITILDGSARMRQRPIKILVDALNNCGANISYLHSEGYPPIKIEGRKFSKDTISLPGNISSQYISALLMISPLMKNGIEIELTGDVISKPYINMTLELMKEFGVTCNFSDNKIKVPNGFYHTTNFTVESDWSAASYWYSTQALLPNSIIKLKNLNKESLQGDSKAKELFRNFGVMTTFEENDVTLSPLPNWEKPQTLKLNLSSQPDLAQTIVVTSCLMDIPFHISGLSTLKIKETDRIEALKSQLLKMGYVIKESADCALYWNGEKVSPSESISIDTFDDHRMAMAFAPASIKFSGIRINDIEVVSKSYPQFWNHFIEAGYQLQRI